MEHVETIIIMEKTSDARAQKNDSSGLRLYDKRPHASARLLFELLACFGECPLYKRCKQSGRSYVSATAEAVICKSGGGFVRQAFKRYYSRPKDSM